MTDPARIGTAVVLGGGSDIAAAVLAEAVPRGLHHALLAARRPGEATARVQRMAPGLRTSAVHWDALDVDGHDALFDRAAAELGAVDLVLCAAGMLGHHAGRSMGPTDVDLMVRTNFAGPAAALAARVRDIHEFLDGLGLVPPHVSVPQRVAYDEPCHLLHAQRLSEPPKRILRAIPGLELVPLRDADRCCGSAGVYNVVHPELASAILDEKIHHIAASGATTVATGNSGCILQIRAGLRRASAVDPRLSGIRVAHPMELLAEGYGIPPGSL
jgi:hypothetical protein